MTIDQIPWSRIVHLYGRAADVPAAIDDLGHERHAMVEKALLHNIEHQDWE